MTKRPRSSRLARAAALLVSLTVAACAPAQTPAPSQTPAPTPSATLAATPSPTPSLVPTVAPTSGLVAADLDGVLVDAALAHRLPLAVSIDDARAARPQSGFNAASVVWQAPADGYETRYLLEFQEGNASDVGPVRSARYYLAHWAAELDAGFAHYGGDRKTRAWMKANRGILFTDIDGLGAGNPAYHRISTRPAPYNAFSSTAELWQMASKLGGAATISAGVHLRPFRDDSPAASRGTKQSFEIPYNTVKVRYEYDSATNAYKRFVNGKVHIDGMDDQAVTARTIVVLFMRFRIDPTIEPGHNRPALGFTGSGVAWIYSEGTLVKGKWTKQDYTDPTVILGPDGTELPFVRGRIFMQVVPIATKVG